MNESNLIPFNELTEEEQREIARKGGIASGEARRRKRDVKDTLDLLLSKPFNVNNKSGKALRKQIESLGINPDEIDNQTAMAYAMFMVAMSGGKSAVAAFNSIRDTLGEKPVEQIKQTIDGEVTTKQKNAVDDVIKQMKPLSEDDV
jgi:hypothetical protein